MTDWKKVTQKEWKQTVETVIRPSILDGHSFTSREKDAVRSAFEESLENRDPGERKSFFGTQPPKGITSEEVKKGMEKLRGQDPVWSANSKITKIDESKLQKLEGTLNELVDKNKERYF